jgi:hypothetical protein
MGKIWHFIFATVNSLKQTFFDEDIPTLVPSSPLNNDQTIAAKKVPTDDIRIGPITRARAKLVE